MGKSLQGVNWISSCGTENQRRLQWAPWETPHLGTEQTSPWKRSAGIAMPWVRACWGHQDQASPLPRKGARQEGGKNPPSALGFAPSCFT